MADVTVRECGQFPRNAVEIAWPARRIERRRAPIGGREKRPKVTRIQPQHRQLLWKLLRVRGSLGGFLDGFGQEAFRAGGVWVLGNDDGWLPHSQREDEMPQQLVSRLPAMRRVPSAEDFLFVRQLQILRQCKRP